MDTQMNDHNDLISDEFPGIFNGYKGKITRILEKELQQLIEDTERDSAKIIANTQQQAQEIIDRSEPNPEQKTRNEIEFEINNLLAAAKEEVRRAVIKAKENIILELYNANSYTNEESEISDVKLKEDTITAFEELLQHSHRIYAKNITRVNRN